VIDLSTITAALGSAVLHFIWQGAAIGVLAAAVLAFTNRSNAAARYATTSVAMSLCFVAFIATFVLALLPPSGPQQSVAASAQSIAAALSTVSAQSPASSGRLLETVAWLWLGGVIFFAVRFSLQWLSARRLTMTGTAKPEQHWTEAFDELKQRLGIGVHVRLLRSTLADVPMVVGWIAPVVLVPASAFTSLTPEQLRAVLVHELAHIRRHDHLFNAVQLVIETILFFHPVTWWLSRQMRVEREHCCDEATVRTTPNPRIFAEALAQLESTRTRRAAIAATGGPLMDRIARIVGARRPCRRSSIWRSALALAAGTAVAITGIAHAAGDMDRQSNEDMLQVLRQIATNTEPDNAQLHELYNLLVMRDSSQQQEIDVYRTHVQQRIDAAVEAGKLSTEEAITKMAEIEKDLREKAQHQYLVDVFQYTEGEAHLAVTRQRLDDAVLAGDISREDADAKLSAVHRRVDLRREWSEAVNTKAQEIDAAIAAGEITREEGARKMAELERSLKMRLEIREVEAKLDAMVASGEMTREQANEHLETVHSKLVARAHRHQGERVERDAIDWDQIKARVEGAVERGEITRAEADRIYAVVKYRSARDKAHREHDIAEALTDFGIDRTHLREVMGVLRRGIEIMHLEDVAQRDKARAELHAHLANELGLTETQIRGVAEIAHRIQAEQDEDREALHEHLLTEFLADAGIPRDKLRTAAGATERLAAAMRKEGDDFKVHPRMTAWLEQEGFTPKQVEIVMATAKKLSSMHR
jgi:beta-lactamase regulating signal transducer with metallopeptidase domain/polyhydroxyalkanoate synthesis regulator phasin